MFARIGALPVPQDRQTQEEIFSFLQQEKCDVPVPLVAYRLAIEGLPMLLSDTQQDYQRHLDSVQASASRENDLTGAAMAATIKATANCIADKKARKQWSGTLWNLARGHEKYFGHKYRVATDPSLPLLAKLSGQKMPPETLLMQPLLDTLTADLRHSVSTPRKLENCRQLAAQLRSAASSAKDPAQKRIWLEKLAKIMNGHETFQSQNGSKKKKVAVRDPCADVVSQAMASL